ncbi:MAG: SDR family NAD(P)-dependent oxidoreductase, partial [Pseudomonadota bacterium]
MIPSYKKVLIIGTGPGLSASFARQAREAGMDVALAARNTDKLADLATETSASVHECDATSADSIAALFEEVDANGPADVMVYNPSGRVHGSVADLDGAAVEKAVQLTALGGFHAAQQAARRMVPNGHGAMLFTGATASVK